MRSQTEEDNPNTLSTDENMNQNVNQELTLRSESKNETNSDSSINNDPSINDPEAGSKKKEKVAKTVAFVDDITDESPDGSHKISSPVNISNSEAQENVFGRIPPELSYLTKRTEMPKPLISNVTQSKNVVSKRAINLDDLPDLPSRAVKEISAVNKNTVLNFNYHEVVLPIGPDRILVEVKYAALFSSDLSKLRKYSFNVSNERIGVGYDFVGKIVETGKNIAKDSDFKKGVTVFGVTNPLDKKGSLQTCVIVNPRDIILKVSDEDLVQMEAADVSLPSENESNFQITDSHEPKSPLTSAEMKSNSSGIPTFAKFCTFGSQFCRARQALALMDRVFKTQETANILINGADTILGRTFVQIISSSLYHDVIHRYNVTLVVSEKNVDEMNHFISLYNPSSLRNFNVVTFDMANHETDSRESGPIHKKVLFFATEILDSISKIIPRTESISKSNKKAIKLDLFIDIIGSKKMFHQAVDMTKLDQINFPMKSRLDDALSPSSIFGTGKGPLFSKLMKPKASGSSFVSFCNFELSEPSYSIEKLVSHGGSAMDPWSLTWTRGLANSILSTYNYYDMTEFRIKKEWVEEAYRLFKAGELQVQIDEYVDWRTDFRKRIESLARHDGSVLFAIESF